MKSTTPVLSSQEQSDLMVRFWEAIEQEAQEAHQQDFLQERAYLLAQNVLQGRLGKEALAKISEKDPACVQEAAKIIGQMESMRDALTVSATKPHFLAQASKSCRTASSLKTHGRQANTSKIQPF